MAFSQLDAVIYIQYHWRSFNSHKIKTPLNFCKRCEFPELNYRDRKFIEAFGTCYICSFTPTHCHSCNLFIYTMADIISAYQNDGICSICM